MNIELHIERVYFLVLHCFNYTKYNANQLKPNFTSTYLDLLLIFCNIYSTFPHLASYKVVSHIQTKTRNQPKNYPLYRNRLREWIWIFQQKVDFFYLSYSLKLSFFFIESQTIDEFGDVLHLEKADVDHLRSVFMAVENGDIGLLKSLGEIWHRKRRYWTAQKSGWDMA